MTPILPETIAGAIWGKHSSIQDLKKHVYMQFREFTFILQYTKNVFLMLQGFVSWVDTSK